MPGFGSPLVIVQAPLSVIISSGSTATFEVVVAGSGVLAYQWQTTDHAIAIASGYNPSYGSGEPAGFWPILGATSGSYTTPTLTATDNGAQFQCLLSNTISTPLMLFSELMTVPVFVVVE